LTADALAIDQGTTSTKAFLLRDGAVTPVGTRTHRQLHPRAGWVEHDAAALLADIRALIAAAGPVGAVALANQGETVVAWDAQTKCPLAPAIVWQDQRTAEAVNALRGAGVETLTLARAGLPLDPYFSASKLRWLLDHVDGAAALRRAGRLRLGTSDAFFLDSLTGVFATDVSTASRTSLMDLRRLCWDPTLCDAFGVPLECLPEIRPTVGDFGALPGAAVVAASVVDQQAALFGHSCAGPGDLKVTFGTGAFALGLTGEAPVMRDTAGLLPTCAWQIGMAPACYALDGGVLTAGAAVDWARAMGLADLDVAGQPGTSASAASRGVFFVPALAGLGCPHWDRAARGAWLGLSLDTSRQDLARAVLEGVALRTAELVRAFAAVSGRPVTRLSVDGGLTRSGYFVAFLADAVGQPIELAGMADMTALGLLGLCLAGTGGPPLPRPAAAWRTVVPSGTDLAATLAGFAEAVARTRGWHDVVSSR
jgi:glycerol kinase